MKQTKRQQTPPHLQMQSREKANHDSNQIKLKEIKFLMSRENGTRKSSGNASCPSAKSALQSNTMPATTLDISLWSAWNVKQLAQHCHSCLLLWQSQLIQFHTLWNIHLLKHLHISCLCLRNHNNQLPHFQPLECQARPGHGWRRLTETTKANQLQRGHFD